MPIYRQTYCHYDGKYLPHSIAWMTIAAKGISLFWRSRTVKFFRFPVIAVFLLFVVWIYFATTEELAALIDMDLTELLERLKIDFEYYYNFIATQMYICLFMTLGICPKLISNDLKYKAIGLYLSKSLTRFDYLVGKGMSLFVFLAVPVIVMPLLLVFLYASFADDITILFDIDLLIRIILFGGLISVSLVIFNLAISAITPSSATVNVTQLIVYFILPYLGVFIEHIVRDYSFFTTEGTFLYFISYYEWWALISPTNIWLHLGQVIFQQDAAYEHLHWGASLGVLLAMCLFCCWYLYVRIKPVEIVK